MSAAAAAGEPAVRVTACPSAQGSVYIKLASESAGGVFAKLEMRAGEAVADLAERACAKFQRWGADAGQVRLYLVPTEMRARELQRGSRADDILAGDALFAGDSLERAGIVSGSWLLARVPPPATTAGASCCARAHSPLFSLTGVAAEAVAAAIAPVLAGQSEVADLLRALVLREAATQRVVEFSKASSKDAANAVSAVGVELRGRLALPDGLNGFMPSPASLVPFEWTGGRGEKRETDESRSLLALLERWVKLDAEPPVGNLFPDVQNGPPMSMQVEGVADFSGVPDAIVVARGIGSREEAELFMSSAVLTVDWNRRSAMQVRGRIAAIGHVHALALASTHNFTDG